MEANYRSLQNSQTKYAPRTSGNSNARYKITRKMKNLRCNSVKIRKAKVFQPSTSKRKTLLEQIYGKNPYKNTEQASGSSRFGTYRTLCVRKSDGYYFPISFSTFQERFEADQETCQAMCPSATVELYHHKMPAEDSEEMINYKTGVAYADEPFAFAYRKSVNIENKCRFATENRVVSIESKSTEISHKPKSTKVGIPIFRQDPALAPDDQQLIGRNLTLEKAKSYLASANSPNKDNENQLLAENRKVRIVGPAFFPVQ